MKGIDAYGRGAAGVLLALAAWVARAEDLPRPPEPLAIDPPLTEETFRAWWERIMPAPEDLAWKKIDWHGALGEGLREAHRLRKPLLVWVMDGHPLACL